MGIPIIFIHQEDSFYLKYSLSQAKFFNPDSPIFLLYNKPDIKKIDKIEYVLFENYFSKALDFEKIYVHMSPNNYQYELFCFQRWLILEEFVEKNTLDEFIYCDSDVLLFCDVNKKLDSFRNFDFSIVKKKSPHTSYFRNLNVLKKFVSFLYKRYDSEKGLFDLAEKHKLIIQNNEIEGISDMTMFLEFSDFENAKVFEMTVEIENEVFDNNIFDNRDYYTTKNELRLLERHEFAFWGFSKSNGNRIKFNSLHFQGKAKILMHRYYIGFSKYLIYRLIDEIKYQLFFKNKNQIRIAKKLKKLIKNKWN